MSTNTNTKSGSVLFTQDINESQLESLKRIKSHFVEVDKKRLLQQVDDLEMTLEINKGIICDLLQCKSLN